MKGNRLKSRDRYLEEAMLFCDTDLVKVIAGVRRCGESSLLDLIRIAIYSKWFSVRGSVSVGLESNGTGIWRGKGQLYFKSLPLYLLSRKIQPLCKLAGLFHGEVAGNNLGNVLGCLLKCLVE